MNGLLELARRANCLARIAFVALVVILRALAVADKRARHFVLNVALGVALTPSVCDMSSKETLGSMPSIIRAPFLEIA